MNDFNPDSFQGDAEFNPNQAAPAAPKGLDFDPDKFATDGRAVDELTGEEIPLPLSGNTPETALNRSIVSAADRLNLSLGNLKGNVDYLKKRFEDVKEVTDVNGQPTGRLAVFKDGSWYNVDPKNGDIQDPWERTKEYMKDAAEFAPEAIGVGAAVGTAFATGGMSIPAAGAVAGATSGVVRTSLGRIIGTYDATPAEQAWDISFETLLNAAGAKIAAGVKPTAKWVAGKADDIATAFKDAVPPIPKSLDPYAQALAKIGRGAVSGGRDVIENVGSSPKRLFAWATSNYSVGADHFERMVQQPNAVKSYMTTAHELSKNLPVGERALKYQDVLIKGQLTDIKKYAEGAKEWSQQLYGAMRNRVLSQVPSSFTSNFDDSIVAVYRDAISKGIGKIDVGGESLHGAEAMAWLNEHGIEGLRKYGASAVNIPKAATKAVGKFMGNAAGPATGGVDDTIEMTLKGAGRARFSMLTPAEMKAKFRAGAPLADEMNYLANNADAWSAINSFYGKLSGYVQAKTRTGVQAAEDLMQFKKAMNDAAYDIANSDRVKGLGNVKTILDSARHQITDSIYQKFNAAAGGVAKAGVRGQSETSLGRSFLEMDSTYAQMKDKLAPVINAHDKYTQTKDLMAFGDTLQSFLAPTAKALRQSVKRSQQQDSLDFMLDIAERYDLKDVGINLAKTKNDIMLKETAKAFNPIKPGTVKAQEQGMNQAGILAYAALSGNTSLLGAVASTATLQGPRTAAAGAAVVRGMNQAQKYIQNQVPSQINKLLSTPEGAQTLSGAGAAAASQYMQASGGLNAVINQIMSQGQEQ